MVATDIEMPPSTGKVEFREVNPERILASPFHSRTDWGDMPTFSASVQRWGVIEPPVCRLVPKPDGVGSDIELIAGAKRVRAAVECGLPRIKIVLHHEVDDRTAVEWQVEENMRRDELHPLDEANYYALLLELGLDKPQIAKRFKVTRARVDQRLKLRDLSDPVKKAYGRGEIPHDIASLLAKLPVKEQQQAVVKAVREGALGDAADVAAYVRSHFLLPLADVPWALDDDAFPGGPCTRCPKRTGTQRELFEDIAGSDDLCTDSGCHRGKMNHAFDRAAAALEPAGGRVLAEVEVGDVFVPGNGGMPTVIRASGYVEATAPCPTVPGRSWLEAAQDAGGMPQVLLIQDQDGRPRVLLDEGDVKRIVRKAAREEGSAVANARAAADPAIALAKEAQAKVRSEVRALLHALIAAPPSAEVVTAVAHLAMADVVSGSTNRAVAEALGVGIEHIVPVGKSLTIDMAASVLAALVVGECGAKRPASAPLRDLARALGVEIAT